MKDTSPSSFSPATSAPTATSGPSGKKNISTPPKTCSATPPSGPPWATMNKTASWPKPSSTSPKATTASTTATSTGSSSTANSPKPPANSNSTPPTPKCLRRWLEKDLAQSHATWKIVSYHRPTFDIITHRTTWGQSDIRPIMEKGGVDIVFAGHTHNYQPLRPHRCASRDKNRSSSSSAPAAAPPTTPSTPPPSSLEKAHQGASTTASSPSPETISKMTAKILPMAPSSIT